jgi:hypothetical protein
MFVRVIFNVREWVPKPDKDSVIVTASTKNRPVFKTEGEEREFGDTHSPLDYFDVSTAKHAVFPNLKPTLKSI